MGGLQLTADTLPAVGAVGNASLRFVGLFSEVAAAATATGTATGHVIGASCFAAWAVADLFAGRVLEKAVKVYRVFSGDAPEIKEP